MVGAIVHQLTRNLKDSQIENSGFAPYFVDHTVGVYPTAASGSPWNAAGMQVTAGELPIADFTDEADALSSRLAVVAERLAAIAAAFRDITPPMPALATGAVIPARVRVSDAPAPTTREKNSDLSGMLRQLVELLTTQATTDKRVQVTVPVQIDRRQLGAAVAEFGLSNKRMTNGGTR